MIHINLLGEKTDTSSQDILQLAGFVALVVLTFGICFGVQLHFSRRLEDAKEEKQRLDIQLTQLKKVTKEVTELEKNKSVLREKLQTIATLLAKQHGPVRVLDDLNTSIPEKTWLTAVNEKEGQLVVQGIALDNETIALFMHDLAKSPYFGAVDLNQSTKEKVKDVDLKKFSLSVTLSDPLKIGKDKAEKSSEEKMFNVRSQ